MLQNFAKKADPLLISKLCYLLECKARERSGFRVIPRGQCHRGDLALPACTEEVPRKEIPNHQRKDCSHDILWPIQKEKISGISQENL